MDRALFLSQEGKVWVPYLCLFIRIPKRKYLRDSKFLPERRTSEKEKAGEIMLSSSDFADKLTECPGKLAQSPGGVGKTHYLNSSPRALASTSHLLSITPLVV